ncbi:MAG TPA: hypothetical protein ENN81_11155 [Phycisphaerales bacterium]|nr:hypothetical protein [Phycisphaerales bacterium]
MIEQALRDRLRPIVRRRQSLYLAVWLSVVWFMLGLVGAALIWAQWYWNVRLAGAMRALAAVFVAATVYVMVRSRRVRPDYRAIARAIERDHPELKALLLTAIEQKARGPDGQLGYLQERVIGEALRHASRTDWTASVPLVRLLIADVGAFAAMLFVLAMVWPAGGMPGAREGETTSTRKGETPSPRGGWQVSVTPGDAEVEAGSPVVVLTRFDGRLPASATLVYTPKGSSSQRIVLNKNLEDPVFGGVIPSVPGNTVYRVEYEGQRTQDFKLTAFIYPELRRADARIVYPAYTHLPEKVVEDTRQVSAVEGSRVTLTFTLNKPVATARLQARDGSAVTLAPDANRPGVYAAAMTATESRRYELLLTDAEGRMNRMPPRFTIDVHKNLAAQVKVKFPNRDISASALEELTLEAEVFDDYGLTGYGVAYAVAGLEAVEVALDAGGRGTRERGMGFQPTQQRQDPDAAAVHGQDARATGKQAMAYVLALEELDVAPDQLVTYHFWADDVGPDGRMRRSYSDIYFAEIRPFEEIFRESESSAAQQEQQRQQQENQQGQSEDGQQRAEQLARLQKEIINATWNVKRKADQAGGLEGNAEDVEVVAQSQDQALQQAQAAQGQAEDAESQSALEAAARHMQTSLEHLTTAAESVSAEELTPALAAEQAAYQELLKLRQRESQVARSRGQTPSRQSARSQEQLQQLEMRQEQDRYETQRQAQPRQEAEQRQDLQMQNRLRELARRQNDMSERLRELEAELRQTQTEQQRQEAQRQLERLRQQQLQSLEDVDELAAQMDRPENRQRTADASRQLDQTRSQVRRSAEQMQQRMVSEAAASAARAGREFEQMREEFQDRTSGQFTQEMQQMREEARQMERRQQEIAEGIAQELQRRQRTLTGPPAGEELAERTQQQQARAQELMEQMRQVSEAAEETEPLLNRRLYDTLRQASTGDLDRALDLTGELLRRNFLPEAQEIEQRAGEAVRRLREGIEEAAEGVLGREDEALRRAREQVEELIRQVNEETARGGRAGGGIRDPNRPGDPNAIRMAGGMGDANSPGDPNGAAADERRGTRDDLMRGRDARGTRGQDTLDTQGQDALATGDRAATRNEAEATRDGQRNTNDGIRTTNDGVERVDQAGGPGGVFRDRTDYQQRRGPIAGRDYRDWSDRLREVEEMLSSRDLREQAAQVRERAREVRTEVTRHGKEPQWDVIEQQITRPLTELYRRLSEELVRLESDKAMAPIDRDPVPGRFDDMVRRYFENLGGGQP